MTHLSALILMLGCWVYSNCMGEMSLDLQAMKVHVKGPHL